MSQSTRNSIGCVALASVLWVGGTSAATRASTGTENGREGSRSEARKLEGTWYTDVTVRDCQTGVTLRTFPALNTFAEGGTLIDTTTAVSPALRSPGHGTWEKENRHSYSTVSLAFLFSPTGVWTGTQRITQAIEVGPGGDDATSDASSQIFNTGGTLTAMQCSAAVLRRLE
jgi:hypothetical protein